MSSIVGPVSRKADAEFPLVSSRGRLEIGPVWLVTSGPDLEMMGSIVSERRRTSYPTETAPATNICESYYCSIGGHPILAEQAIVRLNSTDMLTVSRYDLDHTSAVQAPS